VILLVTASEALKILEMLHAHYERLYRQYDTYVKIAQSEAPRYNAFLQLLRSLGVTPSIDKIELVGLGQVLKDVDKRAASSLLSQLEYAIRAIRAIMSRLGDVMIAVYLGGDRITVKMVL